MTTSASRHAGPWLSGGEPAKGRLARADIRTREDILAIEAFDFGDLLPGNTILDCIEAAAAINPDKAAIKHLVSADIAVAPRVITYRELVAGIRGAASLFEAESKGEKPAVAVILPMMPEAHVAGWGASSVGVCCQINPFLEMKHITAIMNAAKVTVLVTAVTGQFGPGAWDRLGDIMAAVPSLKRVLLVGGDDPREGISTPPSRRRLRRARPSPRSPIPRLRRPTCRQAATTASPKLCAHDASRGNS